MSNFSRLFLAVAFLLVASLLQAQQSDLLVTKSGPVESAADTDVAYNVSVTNLGPDASAAITLDDGIPAGMSFVSAAQDDGPLFVCATPSPGDTIGTTSCTTATLAAGETANFTFVFHIPPGTPDGTAFTNIATSATLTDPNSENDAASATTITPFPPQGDMGVMKEGPAGAGPDTDVVYTITLVNAGPDDALNVTLSDTLPANTTFVSLNQSGITLSCSTPAIGAGGTVTCTAATFPAGGTTTLTLTVHIAAGTSGGTSIANSVSVTSSDDPNEENDLSSTLLIVAASDIAVVKSGPATATAGTNVVYTIIVSNEGPDTAFDVRLDDVLPPDTTFVSLTQDNGPVTTCAFPSVGTNGTVSCNFAALPSGSSAQFTLEIEAGNTASISNTATVVTPGADPDTTDNSSTVDTTVTPSADLSVLKTGPSSVTAGGDATYTITLTNDGPSAASTVSLADTLPPNATLVSLTQNSGPAFACAATTCTIDTLAPDAAATFTLVLHVDASAVEGSAFDNTATASSTTGDPDNGNNTSTANATVATSADLQITKSGPAAANADTDVTYTITVTNTGPSDAAGVSLADTPPADTTFISMTQTSGPAFVCAGSVTCTIATLASGASATFDLVLHVSADATSVANTANVSATTSDPDSENNSATATTTVVAVADLFVDKKGPPAANADTDVTYTITVTNNGPSAATNVSLADPTPANATFVSMTQTSGPVFVCSGSTTCTIATLAAGASATFDLVLHMSTDAATVVNTATVSTTTNDPNNANDSSTATTTVNAVVDLAVVKTGPPTANAGTDVTYAITVTNNGPSSAANVSLADPTPANATFVSMAQTGGPAFVCSGSVTCTIATLAAGASATFELLLQMSPDLATVVNTATVSTTTNDPNNANDTSTVSTTVLAAADLAVVKTGPLTANADTDVTYTITVTNNGPSAATNVSLADPTPAGTTFVSMTQTAGPSFVCAGSVTCTIATLAANVSATFELVLHVSPDATSVVNTATVSTTTNDLNGANDSSTATTAIAAVADLAVVKTGPATADANTDVTYTITVTNGGPSAAANVSLADPTPAGTTFVSMTQTSGPAFTCAGSVTCTIATLAAGASATFDLVLHLSPEATVVANIASISTPTNDPNTANNSSTATTTVTAIADLAVVKTGPPTANADTDVAYTITVTNTGPSAATNVSLADPAPAGTTFVSMTQTSGPTFVCSGSVTCTISTLAAGASATFELVLHASTEAGAIVNTVTVSTSTNDPNTANNNSTATTAVAAIADLVVTKTGPPAADANSDVTYVVTITNNGPSDALSVTLTDPIPPQTTFVSITQTSGPTFVCAGTSIVTCTIDTLAAGASASFNLVVHVDPQAMGTLVNTATATSPTDPTAANNAGSASAAISPITVPTLSPLTLALLALSLAALAVTIQGRI